MKTAKELSETARRHPVYWLESLDIEYGERLIKLKDELARTAHWNEEKQIRLRGKISELHNCLRSVRNLMSECEKPIVKVMEASA